MGNKSWHVLTWKGRARIAIDQAQEFYITIVNFRWKYCQMHRLWTLSKVIIKLQFKQIIIAEIKLDVCIGYKPFISKAVGNVFIKIAYQLIELNQKRYHWQNLDKFEKCDSLWILMCLPSGGDLREQHSRGLKCRCLNMQSTWRRDFGNRQMWHNIVAREFGNQEMRYQS